MLTKESYIHHHYLKSSSPSKEQLLIIIGYDYFLCKSDFKKLLNKFSEIILIPETISLNSFEKLIEAKNVKLQDSWIVCPDDFFNNEIHLTLSVLTCRKTLSFSKFCEGILKKCYIPEDIAFHNPDLANLSYYGIYPRLIKKAVDLGLGFLIWLVSQPIWVFNSVMIRIQSPGPIFFKQKRTGIRNQEFTIIKFRSMNINAEKMGAQFAKKNDLRIFPWGRLMRSSRIDELPQLMNIIRGELSLVGPRPEREIWIKVFEQQIPHYRERHAVKPGISGYAQVMYRYGTGGVFDARHKLMYDLYYIKNWNIVLEVFILLKTISIVITRKGI